MFTCPRHNALPQVVGVLRWVPQGVICGFGVLNRGVYKACGSLARCAAHTSDALHTVDSHCCFAHADILGDSCPFYVLFRTAGAPKGSSLQRHPNLGAQMFHQQPGIDAQALRCCEVLLAAGYRPTVYAEVELESRMPDGEFSDRWVSHCTAWRLCCSPGRELQP